MGDGRGSVLGPHWRLRVGEDEVLAGYVLRLAARAGVTPLDVLLVMGFRTDGPLSQLLMFNGDHEFAAGALGLSAQEFVHLEMIPPLDPVISGAANAAVGVQSGLLRHFSRCCPKCIGETGGVWKRQWRVASVVACLRHEVLLVGRCPSCQRRWFGDSLRSSEGVGGTHVVQPYPLDLVLPAPTRCHALVDGRFCDYPIGTATTTAASDDLLVAMTWLLAGWQDRYEWWPDRGKRVWVETRQLVGRRTGGLHGRSLDVPEDPMVDNFADDVLAAVERVRNP